jgi:hypothetical protein
MTQNTIILGYFNIDDGRRFNAAYAFKNYFNNLDEAVSEFELIHLIEFETWSHIFGNTIKSSIPEVTGMKCLTKD